jgi:transcriptional regulator GlxA family with amidase domain
MPFQEEELLLQTHKLIELRHKLRALYAKPGKTIAPPGCAYLQAEDCFLLKVHSILEARFGDENFGIHDLCQALAMSRTQLYRKFHALTNQSVSRYIRFFRLHKAKEMLENTSLNITQVALETGFKSQSYFSRIFVGEFGFPPSLVRKKHSN